MHSHSHSFSVNQNLKFWRIGFTTAMQCAAAAATAALMCGMDGWSWGFRSWDCVSIIGFGGG